MEISSYCKRLEHKEIVTCSHEFEQQVVGLDCRMKKNNLPPFTNGIRKAIIISESVNAHGCQPISIIFFKACSESGIQQIFASYSNPKGNVYTERVIRTRQEELLRSREIESAANFEKALDVWHKGYNEDSPHSFTGYTTSYRYERWLHASAA